MNPIVGLLAATLLGTTGPAAQDAIDQIVQGQYQSVAVCPRIVWRAKTEEELNGAPGPNGIVWVNEVYDHLREASAGDFAGKFSVKSQRLVDAAFRDRTLDDLYDPRFLQEFGKSYQVDAIVIVNGAVEPGRPDSWRVFTEVFGTKTLDSARPTYQTIEKTLSQAAYAGESFEVRRWVPDPATGATKIVATVDLEVPEPHAFGQGEQYEKLQYKNLNPEALHPLNNRQCPFGFELRVAGQARTTEPFEKDLYVELNPGEEYAVRFWNKSDRPVFFAIYIDGMNSIGKEHEQPFETPTARTWYVPPDGDLREINGWYTINRSGQKYFSERFTITPASESVAGGGGFSDNLGMVTVIAYTYDMDDIPKAPDLEKVARRGISPTFGTGAGSREDRELTFDPNAKKKGIMLASMTVHYRTRQQLDEMRYGTEAAAEETEEEQPFVAKPEKKPEEAKQPSEGTAFPSESDSTSGEKPNEGESVGFPGG
ncbi:Hypothetical protein PBC10988_23880 [Planctomycetales bacterium 10988]|nr:Hypothetical protein PBC10988_23880 [Planctomycetales bacterium 10988]